MMDERLSVIIPTREKELPADNITLLTLRYQTWKDFCIYVSPDRGKGPQYARNRGFNRLKEMLVMTELVLFSDDDIEWLPNAFELMIETLDQHPEASYVYCAYELDGRVISMREYDASILKRVNYISTMSVIRSSHFPEQGFDYNIKRFQDWDLWLAMLKDGHIGVLCPHVLFRTQVRTGITYGNPVTPIQADAAIRSKYGDWLK